MMAMQGTELRDIRNKLGLSGAAFGQLLGLTRETISKLENSPTVDGRAEQQATLFYLFIMEVRWRDSLAERVAQMEEAQLFDAQGRNVTSVFLDSMKDALAKADTFIAETEQRFGITAGEIRAALQTAEKRG